MDEFEQNKLPEVCIVEFVVRIHPHFGVVSQICISDLHENINKPLDGADLTYFGIDLLPTTYFRI